MRPSKISLASWTSSEIGFRAAPPVLPECWSVSAVSSLKITRSNPRRPADKEGRSRETHTVSETTTASVRAADPMARSVSSKWGEPTSSSVSQRKRTLSGTPASRAAFVP